MEFREVFKEEKPIIGMIHLAGEGWNDKLRRAREELEIYEDEEVDGVIIEDYHGSAEDVLRILRETEGEFNELVKGINVLSSPYSGFRLARDYGARFIQFDSVQTQDLDLELYARMRREFSDVAVLGGIGFKYTSPTGNPLERDLEDGKTRCEAIVTTGEGTGIETPLDKLKLYLGLLGDFPLIVGAGVNLENVREQIEVTDGAIIGSYFKSGSVTQFPVCRDRVRSLMDVVREVRG